MFNLAHILYMVISAVITVALLVPAGLFIKEEKYKKLILKIIALVTVALHFSDIYVNFFKTGNVSVSEPHILPIHPCNVVMWLLLICAFLKNRDAKASKALFVFTFYAGVVCGIFGIVLNVNYGNNPTLADWGILKGMLSHSTMLLGCIYILVAKFIKIRVSNCISVFLGLWIFIIDGLIINGLYSAFGLGECNSMYLQSSPIDSLPWLTPWLMGITGLVLVFAITALYEHFALKKEERWFTILKEKINTIKEKKRGLDNE
ncbi:MAG: YwaF family protein [Clostridiales bacterium]|nr:YwaF family protein [Clostridiales bacterium]